MYTGPNITTDGLVLSLDAANGKSYVSGSTVWRDLSGTTVTGSLVNGPTFNSANGGSVVFDGIDDFVRFGNIFNDVMSGEGKQFSYTCCFFPTSTSNQVLFGKYADTNTGAEERQFAVFVRDVGAGFKLDCLFTTNVLGFVNLIRADIPLNLNATNIVTVTYDDTQSTSLQKPNIWINGVLSTKTQVVNGTFGPISAGQAQFGLGAQISSAGNTATRYAGRIYSLTLYSRLLSSTEALQNYNALKPRFNL